MDTMDTKQFLALVRDSTIRKYLDRGVEVLQAVIVVGKGGDGERVAVFSPRGEIDDLMAYGQKVGETVATSFDGWTPMAACFSAVFWVVPESMASEHLQAYENPAREERAIVVAGSPDGQWAMGYGTIHRADGGEIGHIDWELSDGHIRADIPEQIYALALPAAFFASHVEAVRAALARQEATPKTPGEFLKAF